MTTIGEAFPAPVAPRVVPAKPAETVPAAGTPRAAKAAKRARLARAKTVLVEDVRTAWPWHGRPPNLAELWAARIPDLDAVPAGSKALRAAWVVFNHLALALYALAAIPLWALGHPARTSLALLVAAPLAALWIF